MVNFFKNKKKNNSPDSGELETGKIIDNRSRLIIKNTYNICYIASLNKPTNVQNMMDTIVNDMRSSNKLIKHSNVVMVINVHKNIYSSLADVFIHKGNLKIEMEEDDEQYIILIGGTVEDYILLIRSIVDLNNNLLKLIIESLYQLDYRFFEDTLIADRIMDKNMFVFESEQESTNKLDNSNIIHIDDILDLYSAVNGKIPMRKLFKFINITIKLESLDLLTTVQFTNTYKINNTFNDKDNTKLNWAGNSWTVSSLGETLMTIQDSISHNTSLLPCATNTTAIITTDLETWLKDYMTYQNDDFKEVTDSVLEYIKTNCGENFDWKDILLPEYYNVKHNEEETEKYTEEVIDEQIMTNEEYLEYYLNQENESNNLQEE